MNKKSLITLVSILFYAIPGSAGVDNEAPRIVHEPCEEYEVGSPFEVWARFYDDSAIFDPKVHFRIVAQPKLRSKIPWQSKPFVKDIASQSFRANLEFEKSQGRLEYFIEVFDENGNGPALFGTATAPIIVKGVSRKVECVQVPQVSGVIRPTQSSPEADQTSPQTKPAPAPANNRQSAIVQPPPAPPPATCAQKDAPFYCSPIVWISAGTIAAAGLGIGAYFLLKDDPPTPAKNNPVSLIFTAPDPSRSLELRR